MRTVPDSSRSPIQLVADDRRCKPKEPRLEYRRRRSVAPRIVVPGAQDLDGPAVQRGRRLDMASRRGSRVRACSDIVSAWMRAKSSGVSFSSAEYSRSNSTMRCARYGSGYSSAINGAPGAADGRLFAVTMKCDGGS